MAARRAHQLRWPLGSIDALQRYWRRSPKGVAPENLRSGKVVEKDANQGRQASPVGDLGDLGGLGGLRLELGKPVNLLNNIAKDRLALRVAALLTGSTHGSNEMTHLEKRPGYQGGPRWGLCPL